MNTIKKLSPSPAFPTLRRAALTTLQANLGYRCNQACAHCHVEAGPTRTEAMDHATAELVIEFLRTRQLSTLDLTGGAPELNPEFRYLVTAAAGVQIIDRCNLTVLLEPGQEDLAEFLAAHKVHVIASLPCYSAVNVETQRGQGVFEKSLTGMRRLNALGYGRPGSGRVLDLVYNPVGAHLPPASAALSADYRRELAPYGVEFNQLLTLTNMPIKRFRHVLEREHKLDSYMQLLVAAFDAANLEHVMCRSLLSVDWRGHVYDCDFNQMLSLPAGGEHAVHLRDLLTRDLHGRVIEVADHCFGCTAGRGSSCGGALQS